MTEASRYVPQELGTEPEQIYEELRRVQAALDWLMDGYREVLHVEPSKLRVGRLANADGSDWDPGGGAGSYEYTGGGTNGWRMLATGTQY